MARELTQGARVLRGQPAARALLPVTVIFLAANASLSAVLIPLGIQRLGGSEHTGFLLSCLGAGALLSAPALRPLLDRAQTRNLLTRKAPRHREPTVLPSSRTQQAPEQAQVGRVSEAEPVKLPLPKPPDGVMLIRLQVRDTAPPTARDPHSEVQASLGIDLVQDRPALNTLELGPQLLGYLPPERIFRMLTRQDVPAREVPHIRIPPPPRRPVTQQHLICPTQDHGNDVVLLHWPSITLAGQSCLTRH